MQPKKKRISLQMVLLELVDKELGKSKNFHKQRFNGLDYFVFYF